MKSFKGLFSKKELTDYLGTLVEMYDENETKTWSCELDIYGEIAWYNLQGKRNAYPFRYPGQYEDEETGLYYNRFRYYSPQEGIYTQQDPIGLAGGIRLYGYVLNSNTYVDVFGLDSESIQKVIKIIKGINPSYKKVFKCMEFADELKAKLIENKIKGELLVLTTEINGNIWSDKANQLISENGKHHAVRVDDTVFDNMTTKGLKYAEWREDLFTPGKFKPEKKCPF
ncbi:RHS repeat-associated core domain-containing protein [Paenibacillus algorifonticola]|uniref:RHS repeat-associated core domain-containing protein n=2 Tax=Paenibacillus algorifonticola TaxID=684063 RepID=A0A1I2CE82_9BACL|nr:RHS repeat-associated core domain-containing protein [Paenibacillus algorifonticola]